MTSDKVIKTLVISLFSIGGLKLMSKKKLESPSPP